MESTNGSTGHRRWPNEDAVESLLAHPDPPGDVDYEDDQTEPPPPPPPPPDYPGGDDDEELPAPGYKPKGGGNDD